MTESSPALRAIFARTASDQLELSTAGARELAARAVGIHAARVISALPIALARSGAEGGARAMLDFAPGREIVRVRCMRKTLHILPLALAAHAHQSTLSYRERDALRGALNVGLQGSERERLVRAVIETAAELGDAQPRELEQALLGPRRGVMAVRAAMKLAWERGLLVVWNAAGSWDRDRRMVSYCPKTSARLNQPTAADPVDSLLEAYFRAYGPASIRDAAWWSALAPGRVRRHVMELGYPRLRPEGGPELFAPASRLRAMAEVQAFDGIRLLGHEDPLLKAYYETRLRYVSAKHYPILFNQIGEARPAVLVGDRVLGVWSWDRLSRRVRVRLFERDPALRERIRPVASELQAQLRDTRPQARTMSRGGAPLMPEPVLA